MASSRNKRQPKALVALEKCPKGIHGLNQITNGGLPLGRMTQVCVGSDSGKARFGMDFLVMSARVHDELGLFMSVKEDAGELAKNAH